MPPAASGATRHGRFAADRVSLQLTLFQLLYFWPFRTAGGDAFQGMFEGSGTVPVFSQACHGTLVYRSDVFHPGGMRGDRRGFKTRGLTVGNGEFSGR